MKPSSGNTGGDPVQMAYRLQSFSWRLSEAAWAAVHWDVLWMAAAIANERQARRGFHPEASAPAPPPPKRTNRLLRTVRLFRTPRFTAGSAKPPARGKEPSDPTG